MLTVHLILVNIHSLVYSVHSIVHTVHSIVSTEVSQMLSEEVGEKVHILSHHPPSSCLKGWAREYTRIVNRSANIVYSIINVSKIIFSYLPAVSC